MAAAGRAPARSCCRRGSRPSRRCPSCARIGRSSRSSSMPRERRKQPFGRITAFHGQMGMFVRALAYMLSHGADGMRQASEDAVLNANYVRAGLSDLMSLPFGDQPCMHEVLFDDAWLKDTGVTTLDFRQGDDRRGLPPDDGVFSARRPRRHADRADGIGIEGLARPLHRDAAGSWRSPQSAATRTASPAPPTTRRAAASTRPAPPATRS